MIAIFVTALLHLGCERRETSAASGTASSLSAAPSLLTADELLRREVPALSTKGRKLIDVLNDLNHNLNEIVGGDSRGEIVIVRHHPTIDMGDKVLEVDIPASMLGEQLNNLGVLTLTHWAISENGYLVFRTWHRPQFDFEDAGDDALTE